MPHEFYQFLVGSPSITLYNWKQVARSSIEYSCLSEKQIEQGLLQLEKDWKAFIKMILSKFGHLLDKDGNIDEEKIPTVYQEHFENQHLRNRRTKVK